MFHLPALNLGVPSNLMEYYSIMVPIVNFDVLSSYQWYQDFLEWMSEKKKTNQTAKKRSLSQSGFSYKTENPEDPLISNQIQAIGYESHNPLENLGTVTVVLMFYILKVLVLFLIIKPCNLIVGIGKQFYLKWYHQLFFGQLLQLFLGMYLEVLFIGVLSMYTPYMN